MYVNRHVLHCYCLHLTGEIYLITKNRQKNISLLHRMSKRIPTMIEVFMDSK